jgi:hypothetical integral membrane protein (TIGR02206 family)
MSMQGFRPFSLLHLGVVVLFSAVWAGIIVMARRRRETRGLKAIEGSLAGLALTLWVVANGWWLLPRNFDAAHNLPIQVCDITSFLIPFAYWSRKRALLALIYFWGIGLSLQAVLTPDIEVGPSSLDFWVFWFHHSLTVGTAAYMVIVRGYRPAWWDYRLAVGCGLLYVAIMLPVDIVFDVNYGYVGNMRPSQPSLIDVLGPWPWRVGVMVILACAVMALMVLPWHWARKGRRAPRVSR